MLEQKIAQVKLDIEEFRNTGKADKRVETLMFYQEYLEDELRMMRQLNP